MKHIIPTWWGRHCIACCAILLLSQTVVAQQTRLIIHASSTKVDIRDGEILQKGVWNLSPHIKPDVYYCLNPVREKTITFYTDLDSISFQVSPGKSYDFVIVLNNTDTCYTQISTSKPQVEPPAHSVSLEQLPIHKLKEDFMVFRRALEKEHAGLYRYKSKKDIDKLFDSCLIALNHPMTQLEFGKSIMYLISSIQDGHTGTNIPRLLMDYYSQNEKMFPVLLYFVQNKAYVRCSSKELPAESEILTIDQQSIPEIVNRLFAYLPSDGKIETKKRHTLNSGAFPFLYHLIFGNKKSFLVRYKTVQGDIQTTTVAAQFIQDFACDISNESAGNNKDLQLQFLQNNIALLTIKTFDDRRLNGKESFINFLETSFKEVINKKVDKLLIDLRGNGGGADEFGALLYAYLTSKPFRYFASKASATGSISLKENPLLGIQQPQVNNYQGKVFFLIDGVCFSTTADFCAIAKSHQRGKFIGEETGGGYYGNTSGGRKDVPLPNSGINIIIPTFKYVNAVKKAHYPDRGILPDYPVTPTIHEIIHNKDVVLDFALTLAAHE